jgi:hypothetical protein
MTGSKNKTSCHKNERGSSYSRDPSTIHNISQKRENSSYKPAPVRLSPENAVVIGYPSPSAIHLAFLGTIEPSHSCHRPRPPDLPDGQGGWLRSSSKSTEES